MPKEAHQIFYPVEGFMVSDKKLDIRIGENHFTDHGISLNIRTERLILSGKLRYTAFTPLKYDIMGPFRYIPFMQCRHSIFSLAHGIYGEVTVNGLRMEFQQGLGYTEGDRGIGFPGNYLWTQCSWFEKGYNSVMISVADVKSGGFSFPGCIGVIYYAGKEYRFATYLGAGIKRFNKHELWVRQGKYDLQVKILEKYENCLLAPVKGKMIRTVYESVDSKIQYRFMAGGNIIFNFAGKGCFERGL